MAAIHSNTGDNTEEIDLLKLLAGSILFLLKNRILFLSAVLTGVCLGFLYFLIAPKIYSSHLIIQSDFLTNAEQIEIVKDWDLLLEKREYTSLAAYFNCNEKTLSSLADIKARDIQKSPAGENRNGLSIDVKITDGAALPELQKAIISGLENNEYVIQRVEIKRENLKTLIQRVKSEINKLDSTKSQIENIINNKQKNTSPFILDVSSVNRQIIDMNEKLVSYEESLKFTKAVQVLQSFHQFNKPDSPKLLKSLVLGFILGAVAGCVIALCRYLADKINEGSLATKKNQ